MHESVGGAEFRGQGLANSLKACSELALGGQQMGCIIRREV